MFNFDVKTDYNMKYRFFLVFICWTLCYSFSQAQPLSPITPKNGLVFNNDSIFLRWNKLPNALYYELKVTPDSTFQNNITTINTGLQTSYWLTALQSNTTYYWRVSAYNGINTTTGLMRRFTNFKPTDILGCSVWLRADTGLVLNGNKVQTWQDASSSNQNFVQVTNTAQPTLQQNAIAGKPALAFDGDDMFLINNFPYGANENTSFVIGKKSSSTAPVGHFMGGNNYDFDMQTTQCVAQQSELVGQYDIVKWSLLSFKRKSTNSQVFVNGILSLPVNSHTLYPLNPGILSIGIRNPALNLPRPLNGSIAEIIMYRSPLSAIDYMKPQNYLMDKFTTALNIGADTIINNNFCPITLASNDVYANYLWSTGDTTPTITVSKSGIYSLQVQDMFGRLQSDTVWVTYPSFFQLNNTELCLGNQLTWNPNLTGTYFYEWQDGSTLPSYTISQAGSFYVKVTDMNGCVFISDTAHVYIDYFSQEANLGNDTALCSGNTIQLQQGANTAQNYLWSNGSTNDSLVVTNGGVFWLEVSNINNCIARDTIFIALNGVAPNANFTSTGFCFGNETHFTNLSSAASGDNITAYVWSFGDADSSFVLNPLHEYNSPGNYLVTLKVFAQSGCVGLIQKNIKIFPHPDLDFSIKNNCESNATQFNLNANLFGGAIDAVNWNFGNISSPNNTAIGDTVYHEYMQVGIYPIQLITHTIEGCIDTLVKPIQIKPSPLAQFEFEKLCSNDSIKFKDISYIPYPQQNILRQWVFNDSIMSSDFEPKMFYNSSGTYPVQLVVMASNGCRDTLNENVFVSNQPIAGFKTDNLCYGNQSLLIDTSICQGCSINAYSWSINGFSLNNTDTLFYIFPDTGIYTVGLRVQNTNLCQNYIEKQVYVFPKPKSYFKISPEFGSPPFQPQLINLSEPSMLSYLWSLPDHIQSDLFQPFVSINDTGSYSISLIVSDTNYCTDTASVFFRVVPEKIDITLLTLDINKQNSRIETEITFINKSSGVINNFDISITSNGINNNIIEQWTGVAQPGSVYRYKLKSIITNDQIYHPSDYLCVKISNLNLGNDSNPEDNELCQLVNNTNFLIANIFPNPVTHILYQTLVVPDKDNAVMRIYDSKGSLVESKIYLIEKGVNRVIFDSATIEPGIYQLCWEYKGAISRKSFVKQ